MAASFMQVCSHFLQLSYPIYSPILEDMVLMRLCCHMASRKRLPRFVLCPIEVGSCTFLVMVRSVQKATERPPPSPPGRKLVLFHARQGHPSDTGDCYPSLPVSAMKPSTPEFVTQHFPTDYIDKRFMLQWLKSTFGEHFYAEVGYSLFLVQYLAMSRNGLIIAHLVLTRLSPNTPADPELLLQSPGPEEDH